MAFWALGQVKNITNKMSSTLKTYVVPNSSPRQIQQIKIINPKQQNKFLVMQNLWKYNCMNIKSLMLCKNNSWRNFNNNDKNSMLWKNKN